MNALNVLLLPAPFEPRHSWQDDIVAAIRAPRSRAFSDSSLPFRPQLAQVRSIVDFGDSIGTIVSTDIADIVHCLQNQMNTLCMWRHGWKSSTPLRSEDALLDGIHVWSLSW